MIHKIIDSSNKTEQTSDSSNIATATTIRTVQSNTIQLRRRIVRNYLLIWLNDSIDETKEDYQNALAQLRNIVNDTNVFTNTDQCVDFITDIDDERVFMIISGALGKDLVPKIHDIAQISVIYIFCDNKEWHEQWAKEWLKIKGVHAEITHICEALRQASKQTDQDLMPISFVPTTGGTFDQSLDQLEPSYMYTQIFKEILLEMVYSQQSICDFTAYCRSGNDVSINNINKFEREYHSDLAIWWYTYPSSIFSLLNGALRTLESQTIMKMGFFIRDLHHQIEKLHQQQFGGHHDQVFIVYRGQGLSNQDLEKLQKTKGGLIAFNNFLSTSKDRDVSLTFAKCALSKPDSVGILFRMTINLSISSTPFALIDKFSYFKDEEEEVLFSMHTVFRIGKINTIENNNHLYEVQLQLTADNDQEFRTLTEQIRQETFPDVNGWHRMVELLIKLGHFNQAEQVCSILLEQTTGDKERGHFYYQLGLIQYNQGDYKQAILFYEKHLEICQKTLPPNHPSLTTSYNNIGVVYDNMGEYSEALSFYERALEIKEKTLPPNHSHLANFYNNIGAVYDNMGEYSRALSFYEKALEIKEKTLSPNHPDLATSYNNMGQVYYNMGEYPKALSFHEKALKIFVKILPPNHPSLPISYNNIGLVYINMEDHSKALTFYERALEIQQKILPLNHPDLATSFNNIGLVYIHMEDHSKVLSFYEKALEIQQKILPLNLPALAVSCNNVGQVFYKMGKLSNALLFYEKALEIFVKTLPPNHPHLAICHHDIGLVHKNLGNYTKALPFHERAVQIGQYALPPNHPHLQLYRKHLEFVKQNL
jgi:tetratricopeptide (TPR) repeat protein